MYIHLLFLLFTKTIVLKCLPDVGWKAENEMPFINRRDLRHLEIASVDPPGMRRGRVGSSRKQRKRGRGEEGEKRRGAAEEKRNVDVTIGCVDIDDALHVRQIGDDLFEVGVRIFILSLSLSPNKMSIYKCIIDYNKILLTSRIS